MGREKLLEAYNRQAIHYDMRNEKGKGIDQKWRREIISQARGNILELAVGAGSNFKFYGKTMKITAVDLSAEMLKKARARAQNFDVNVEFIESRVEDLEFADNSFDTIISTFSMCAYEHPVQILNRINRWCKDDGLILLLEHGVSRFTAVNWLQNALDNYQLRKIGCHTNRDILGLVEQSKLEIMMHERKFLGAIYLIWAKPGDRQTSELKDSLQ